MKRTILIAMFGLLPIIAVAQQPPTQHSLSISKTDEDVQATVLLLGRGCRASDDNTWINVCSSAITQALKEIEALKVAKTPPPAKDAKPETKKP